MAKSILESLSVKTNKSELEQTEELFLSSIDGRLFEIEEFMRLYKGCEAEKRSRVVKSIFWELKGKLDEIEDLLNILDQKNESLENKRSYINQLNHENHYNYDNSIEEISLELSV